MNDLMAYLRTVLSYQLPSEAELDKSFLESHGITVYLMNNQTTRNELGPLFWIQLQVPDGRMAVGQPDSAGGAARAVWLGRARERH